MKGVTYRCGNCGKRYTFDQYMGLEDRQIPDSDGEQRESICERCGAGFHSDKWQRVDTVEYDGTEFRVSTVALMIAHGPDNNQWFETCVFWDGGSYIVDRYTGFDMANGGHTDVVDAIETGDIRVADRKHASIEINP